MSSPRNLLPDFERILRNLFPDFERPAPRRYLNIRPQPRRLGRKIAGGLFLSLICAIALAPLAATDSPPSSPALVPVAYLTDAAAQKAVPAEPVKTAAAKPACTRTTARKDCAEARAAKAALLAAAVAEPASPPAPASAMAAPVVVADNRTETPARVAGTEALAAAEPASEADAVAPAKPATKRKAKKTRVADAAPAERSERVERLVRVYDQVLPDGRRVPVYRRANGGFESGSIVNGEYRRTALALDRARYFGMQ